MNALTQGTFVAAQDVAAIHAYCAVYTVPEVAQAMLDHLGWTHEADLRGRSLLEPSCGDGAFLLPAVERLLANAKRLSFLTEEGLSERLLAFEFDPATAAGVRGVVESRLIGAGLGAAAASRLAAGWVRCEDFLLAADLRRITDIVGNPPYMRWSKLPSNLRSDYEQALPKHAAKGDLCLAFICKGAGLLEPTTGRMALLCADRWLRCAYGAAARAELMKTLRVALHIEAHGLPVFAGDREVTTSAAVTVFDGAIDGGSALRRPLTRQALLEDLRAAPSITTERHTRFLRGQGGALLADEDLQSVILEVTERLPGLEGAGVSVRCGMALGLAKVFIIDEQTGVEADRLIPLVRSQDLLEDGTTRSIKFLANPWGEDGALVSLADYPKLASRLQPWRSQLEARACVTRPEAWYRTIDRVHSDLGDDRILLAGMARRARLAMAKRGEQPTNAVYVLKGRQWEPEALFGALSIGLLDLFSAALSPTFAGGSKRFDGNMLRQVRIPAWLDVDRSLVKQLAGIKGGSEPHPDLVCDLLGVSAPSNRLVVRDALERTWRRNAITAAARDS